MNLYELIRELKVCRSFLTPQEYRTLKGQAIRGDVEGAEKGLQRLRQRRQHGNHKKEVR